MVVRLGLIAVMVGLFMMLAPVTVHAWPWPDTGQTKCYNDTVEIPCPAPGQPFYGQDAQYQGPTRFYTKLGQNGVALSDSATQENGWVMTRDNVTGLVWEMKTDDDRIHDKDKTFTWCDKNPATNGGDQGTCGTGTGDATTDTEAFINALNDTHYGGFSDWRLPTIKELSSLVNSAIPYPGPTIDAAWFPYTESPFYWSSTTNAYYKYYPWYVAFDSGGLVTDVYKSGSCYVRAVRGGSDMAALVDNGNDTVTDTTTGLMWQKTTAPGFYTWQQALAYAETLTIAGYTDWRLPNRNELQSLVDYSRVNPSIDPLLAPHTVSSDYWSSTTIALYTNIAWFVDFYYGGISRDYKSYSYYVRAVRAGQSGLSGHLFISSPSQADRWNIGEQKTITWDTAGIAGNVKITLSRQGGKAGTFETIIASTENDGTYNWTVTGPFSVNCVLKIEPLNDPSKATSQGLFSIYGGLYANFTGSGIRKWDGSAWNQITASDPESMVTGP